MIKPSWSKLCWITTVWPISMFLITAPFLLGCGEIYPSWIQMNPDESRSRNRSKRWSLMCSSLGHQIWLRSVSCSDRRLGLASGCTREEVGMGKHGKHGKHHPLESTWYLGGLWHWVYMGLPCLPYCNHRSITPIFHMTCCSRLQFSAPIQKVSCPGYKTSQNLQPLDR